MKAATVRVLVVASLSIACTAGSASAQVGKGWLERLSGPGPFDGPTFEARFLCLGGPATDTSAARSRIGSKPIGRLVVPAGERAWLTAGGCHFLPQDTHRLEIGVQLSPMHSSRNALDYSHSPGLTEEDLQVNLFTLLFTADIRVNRVLDVGAAIGRASFSSEGDIFRDFSRVMYQPMRLTTRPLAAIFSSAKANALVVQFDGTRFKKPFTAENFGARPGSYNEPGEMNWTWAFKLDVTALFW